MPGPTLDSLDTIVQHALNLAADAGLTIPVIDYETCDCGHPVHAEYACTGLVSLHFPGGTNANGGPYGEWDADDQPCRCDLDEREGGCPDCGCPESDHAFGDRWRSYRDQLANDGECPRDGPNPCLNCCRCGRDEEGN